MAQTTAMLQDINALKSPLVVLGTPFNYDWET